MNGVSAEEVVRRLALMGRVPDTAPRPRGDHDLNPELYQPGRHLIPAAVLVPIVEREHGGKTVLGVWSQETFFTLDGST